VERHEQTARYHLLQTVREYARERLRQMGEEDWARSRHLDFFLRLAGEVKPRKVRAGETVAFDRLSRVYDNLRAALEWSAAAEARAEGGLRLAAALSEFWQLGHHTREGYNWLQRLLEWGNEAASAALRARALQGAGEVAGSLGDFHAARSCLEQSLALCRALDDKPGIAYALLVLGNQAVAQDEWAAARPFIEECLALYRDLGDRPGMAAATTELGYLTYWQGDCAAGRALLEESLAMQRELGLQTYACRSLLLLGHIACQEGCYTLARSCYVEYEAILWEIRLPMGLFYGLTAFGCLAAAEGQFGRAARLCGATERVGETTGIVMVPHERTRYDRAVAAARAGLSAEAFAAAWAAGHAETPEEAVAYALEETS
jgi:non-specific serine/threonine protein kinase